MVIRVERGKGGVSRDIRLSPALNLLNAHIRGTMRRTLAEGTMSDIKGVVIYPHAKDVDAFGNA